MALPMFPPVIIGRVQHFDDHCCKVIECVTQPTKMLPHGFIRELSIVIGAVAVHSYMQRILRFSNVLLSTYTALNKIIDATGLTISGYTCIEFFTSHCARKLVTSFNMATGLTGGFSASAISCIILSWRFHRRSYQKIFKVTRSPIGH